MKYKKWWWPPIFTAISAIFVGISLWIYLLVTDDNSMTNPIYALLSAGVWFFIAIPCLSLIYSKVVIVDERERILLTFYNSLAIVLPSLAALFISLDSWFVIVLVFVWTELWALLGLEGKGEKKFDVWYVPVFIGLAAFIVDLYFGVILNGYWPTLIIFLIICPIAIVIYARVCVRDRKGRVFYTIYSSLLVLASMLGCVTYSIVNEKLELGDSVWKVILLVLSAIGAFALCEFSALLGAGVKIKNSKNKEKEERSEEPEEKK